MRTILIVDDDPVSVRLLEMIVGRAGYSAATASSAAGALTWLEGEQPVEMMITDQNLGGVTGLDLCAALHADVRFRKLPVIICSGVADRSIIAEAMRLGVQHFIVKPIMPKVVMEKVAAIAAERPRALESRVSAMARLQISDLEYKGLILRSRQHIVALRGELFRAHQAGDRVTTILVAGRLREPATLLDAAGLLGAIDALEATRTWHDLEDSVAVIFDEVRAVESALDVESKPQLIGRSMGSVGPDL